MSKGNLSITLELIRNNVPDRILIQPTWRPWVLQNRPGQSKPVKMPLMRVEGVWGTKGGYGGGDPETAAKLEDVINAPRCERLGVTVNTERFGWAVLDIDWKTWTGRSVRVWLAQTIKQAEEHLEAAQARRNAIQGLDLSGVSEPMSTPLERLERAEARLEQLNDLEYTLETEYDQRVWDMPWVAFRLLHRCVEAGAWVEFSVSGLGAHAYIPTELRDYGKNETRPAWDSDRWPALAGMTIGANPSELAQLRTGNNTVGLEFYVQGRFIAVTGEGLIPGLKVPLKPTEASRALFSDLMVSKGVVEFLDASLDLLAVELVTADRVTDRLGRVLRASQVRSDLWNGVSSRHNTESEADWAVIMLVAENSGSVEQAWAHLCTCPQLQKNQERRQKFMRLGSGQLSKAMALAAAKGVTAEDQRPPMADWSEEQNITFMNAAVATAGAHAASIASMRRLVVRIIGRGRTTAGVDIQGLTWFSLGSQADILRDVGGQAGDLRRRLNQLHVSGTLHGLQIEIGDIRVAIPQPVVPAKPEPTPTVTHACDDLTAEIVVMDAMIRGLNKLPQISRATMLPQRRVWEAMRGLSRRRLIHGMTPRVDAAEWAKLRPEVIREERELTILRQKARKERFETERARRWDNRAAPVQSVADVIEVPDEAYAYTAAEIERATLQFAI